MTKLMRWISRSVFHAQPFAHSGMGPSVAHIDARDMAPTEFRASDAMILDDVSFEDFCETLPAFVRGFPDGAAGVAAGGVVGRP